MLLNPTQQLFGLAFDALEIVAREPGPLLFQPAFDDVKIAFDFEFCHKSCDLSVNVQSLQQTGSRVNEPVEPQ
jgi:hypothetical protein